MKERPILFSAPMVQALLEGRKTQTRRIVKPQPEWAKYGAMFWKHKVAMIHVHACPHGKPGDRLWVKETHAFIWPDEYEPENLKDCNIEYRSDTDGKALPGDWPEESRDDPERPKWRPSIFMPRWASRILLEITAVRVERLQDISKEDAIAEGVESDKYLSRQEYFDCVAPAGSRGRPTPLGEYRRIWESINGAGSWDTNPFVWVIEFKRIES